MANYDYAEKCFKKLQDPAYTAESSETEISGVLVGIDILLPEIKQSSFEYLKNS